MAKSEVIAVYIDGGNTYRRLREIGVPKKSKRFDFSAFAAHLVGDRSLGSKRYYVGIVKNFENTEKGEKMAKSQQKFLEGLRAEDFDKLNDKIKGSLLRIAYLSPKTSRWAYPSEEDPAQFTNHSEKNNLSVFFDEAVSEEPFFTANRDIPVGEELTVNYTEFDARPCKVLEWE